jgi:hypothetical protein
MRYFLEKAELYKAHNITKKRRITDICIIVGCIVIAIGLIILGVTITFDVTYNTLFKATISIGVVVALFNAIMLLLSMYAPTTIIALKPYIDAK